MRFFRDMTFLADGPASERSRYATEDEAMSMELHVLAEDSRLPDARRWQEAINALGFDLKLDSSLSVREQTGFLPCTFKGRQSGFEFDVFPASDIVETYPEFEDHFSGRNTSAN